MKKEKFEELKNELGSDVVYMDENEGYMFSIGDDVFDMDEEELDEYERLEGVLLLNGVEGIGWWLGYGDDYINCVSVKNLEDFDKVEGLEEFVLKYVGENCYNRDDDGFEE